MIRFLTFHFKVIANRNIYKNEITQVCRLNKKEQETKKVFVAFWLMTMAGEWTNNEI